jgi:hypothetical protein
MKKLIVLLGVLVAPAASRAQSGEEIATYLAVARTPAGGLAPMLTNTLLGRASNGASLGLRYANLASGDFNNTTHTFGVTGVLPAGLGASVRITGGVLFIDEETNIIGSPTPGDAPGRLMLSLGGDMRLTGYNFGSTATSPLFTVSLDGEVGYANADPGSFFSGYVGAPMALVQRGNGMQFVPFITPAFVVGQVAVNGNSTSGAGMMLGGGLGIYNSESGVIINVGAQHSFMNGARNTIGINLLIGSK